MKSLIIQRVKKHRDTLRAAGLRPIQLWLPDTRNKHFVAECKRQSLLLGEDKNELIVEDWLESVADREGWQ